MGGEASIRRRILEPMPAIEHGTHRLYMNTYAISNRSSGTSTLPGLFQNFPVGDGVDCVLNRLPHFTIEADKIHRDSVGQQPLGLRQADAVEEAWSHEIEEGCSSTNLILNRHFKAAKHNGESE